MGSPYSINASTTDPVTILTKIRCSKFDVLQIKRLSDKDLQRIKLHTKKTGVKILKSGLLETAQLEKAQKDFFTAIDSFFESGNYVSFVSYACNLLQYYTIICDDDFTPALSYADFNLFLHANRNKFGDVEDNWFIIEYKLIKIFNDLDTFLKSIEGQQSPIKNLEEANYLLEHFNQLQNKITDYSVNHAPDNVFVRYLSFACCYTNAIALELQFKLTRDESTDEEKAFLAESQQQQLNNARACLEDIKELYEYAHARGRSPNGMEFSLGQDVLYKSPYSDSTLLKEQLSRLTI